MSVVSVLRRSVAVLLLRRGVVLGRSAALLQLRDVSGVKQPPPAELSADKEQLRMRSLLNAGERNKAPEQHASAHAGPSTSTSLPPVGETRNELRSLLFSRNSEKVFATFERMRARGVELNVIMYNMVISVAAKEGRIDKAFDYFAQMSENHLEPDAATYGSLFDACANSRDIALALTKLSKLHTEVRTKCVQLGAVEYGGLMKAYSRLFQIDRALAVYDEMVANRVVQNAAHFAVLIFGLGNAGRFSEAFEVYRKMIACGLRPNSYVLAALFNACAKTKDRARALAKIAELRSEFDESKAHWGVVVYNSLIHAYVSHGEIDAAVAVLFETMIPHKIRPDVVTFNTLIAALAKVGRPRQASEAFNLYNKMPLFRVAGDAKTYGALFIACGGIHYKPTAMSLLAKLERRVRSLGIRLTPTGYQSQMKAYAIHAEFERVSAIAAEAKAAGASLPTLIPFLYQLRACAQNQNDGFALAILVFRQLRTELPQAKLPPVDASRMGSAIIWLLATCKNRDDDWMPMRASSASSAWKGVLISSPQAHITHPEFKAPVGSMRLETVRSPIERLALLGGVDGVLQLFDAYGATMEANARDVPFGAPDTGVLFAALLDLCPNSKEADDFILARMSRRRTPVTISVVNTLITRRYLRSEWFRSPVPDALAMVNSRFGLDPDVATFRAIAFHCRSLSDALALFAAMQRLGFEPNAELIGRCLHVALCVVDDAGYATAMLRELRTRSLMLNYRTRLFDRLATDVDAMRERVPMNDGEARKLDALLDEYNAYESWVASRKRRIKLTF